MPQGYRQTKGQSLEATYLYINVFIVPSFMFNHFNTNMFLYFPKHLEKIRLSECVCFPKISHLRVLVLPWQFCLVCFVKENGGNIGNLSFI